MWNESRLLVLIGLRCASVGCGEAERRSVSLQSAVCPAFGERVRYAMMGVAGGGGAGNSQRFIATRHKLEVIAPESNLPKACCGTIECTVVSSNLVAQRRDAAPSGSMSLRISPGDLKKLFDQVEKQGQIVG